MKPTILPGLLMIVALWSPPGSSQERPPQLLKGWGQVVDPHRDCHFGLEDRALTIAVPGTPHDLSIEAGDVSAPRVLREIEGDFIAQVKVTGNVTQLGDRTSKRYHAYHGAGLLLWQDERNYIRLERAATRNEAGVVHYLNFELRKDGEHFSGSAVELPDQDVDLRIERRGGRVGASIALDGVSWQSLKPLPVTWPPRIKLGVAAINTSTERFRVGFHELEVYKKEVGRGP